MAIENSVSNNFYLHSSIVHVLTFSVAAYPVCTTSDDFLQRAKAVATYLLLHELF